MRLFIAIDLPACVKDFLRRVQDEFPDAQMSKTHDFHLTLKFLGECSEEKRAKVEKQLAQVEFKPFFAEVAGLGTFGGKIPRVIWIGLVVPDWLKDTVSEIEDRVKKFGFEKENRFVPHITLARVRFADDPKTFSDKLSVLKARISAPAAAHQVSQHVPKKPEPFWVSNFHLFESKLSPKGAVHTILSTFSGSASNS